MDKLPEEIERLIFSFVPVKILALCNKEYWNKNNKQTRNKFYIYGEKYHRFLIRNDSYFIFESYLHANISLFKKKKKIIYHNKIFYSKLEFLRYLSKFLKATKCIKLINEIMKMERLVFKKIKTKSNRWSN